MAVTPEIRSSQSQVVSVVGSAGEIDVSQFQAVVPYRKTADLLRAAAAQAVIPYRKTAADIEVSQANIMVVSRSQIQNTKLISWTYTLDGHDMWVLKLGTQGKTMAYDLTTGQWSWFSTADKSSWQTSMGMNWRSSYSIPGLYGSNIIAGDDNSGVIWVLNPDQGLDDLVSQEGQQTFPRIATGQMTVRGRNSIPVYSTYLTASLGNPSEMSNTVTLEYSDDQGQTYITADQPQVSVAGNYAQEFVWRSLGQVRAPGRLFKITDDGAFARIDGLDVNENEGA